MNANLLSRTVKDIPSSGQYVSSIFSTFILSSSSCTSCSSTLTYKAVPQYFTVHFILKSKNVPGSLKHDFDKVTSLTKNLGDSKIHPEVMTQLSYLFSHGSSYSSFCNPCSKLN